MSKKKGLLGALALILPGVSIAIQLINDYVQSEKMEKETKELIDQRLEEKLAELKDEEA